MTVVVLKRITITTVTVMAAKENILHIPEVPLMIQGHSHDHGSKKVEWMRVNAGLIVLCVLLLPHLL